MERPQSLRIAVSLMFVGAGLSLLGMIAGLAQVDEIEEIVVEDSPTLTADQVDAAVAVAQTVLVLSGLLGVGLWIWMAIMNGQGKSWARVTGTVFAGINLFSLLTNLAMGRTPPLAFAINVTSAVLAVVILILMYQRDASAYYDAMSRRPMPHGYGYRPY
jgi:hypothetical protein